MAEKRHIGVSTSFLVLLLVTMVTGKIKLVNNGYEGVVVTINPNVPENPIMLSRLETIFTKASAMLFRATHNRLYFKEFVVLPEDWTWKPKQNYQKVSYEHLEKADVIIESPHPAYGNTPYVKQHASCGKSGLYMHLTPEYVMDKDNKVNGIWGRPEQTVVHEWAHLRWGIFDEYPIDAEDSVYYLFGGQWFPTRCSNAVKGWLRNSKTKRSCRFDLKTGTAEKNCRFSPDRMTKEVASLMFASYLENVVEFCEHPQKASDHLKHNIRAPNRQNRLCRYKSAWEVMRMHEDFGKDTKELPSTTDTRPTFKYVQVKQRKRVLVMDTSGSMEGNPLIVMNQAASSFILSSIEDGSHLGIVHFSKGAAIICPLREVRSEGDRINLINCLPGYTDGATSIGAGLQKGIEVLSSGGDMSGGTIILITDGEENQAPFISDVMYIIVNREIVVHSLAYSQNADNKISNLALNTGGNTFFYSGAPNSTGLIDGLSATVQKENSMLSSESVSHSILTNTGVVKSDVPFNETFYIDSTIGRNMSLTFTYTEVIDVVIEGPDGVQTSQTMGDNYRLDTNSKVLRLLLKPDPSPGKWTYTVSTNAAQSSFTVNVQSKARRKGQDTIKISSWIAEDLDIVYDSKKTLAVYAEVVRGKAPLINAKVLASIERPEAPPLDLLLLDNGIGSDIIKSDGVYTANILAKDMTGNGRYNIKVKVAGTESQTKVIVGGMGTNNGALDADAIDFQSEKLTEPIENFQRVTTAGEFRLKGFPSLGNNAGPLPDEMAPARINDFILKSFDYKQSMATVTWTAVGGDMERGSASKYIIYISQDFDEILKNITSSEIIRQEQIRLGKLDHPNGSGEKEEFILHLKSLKGNDTVFLSIVAIDEFGNIGEASNVVSISPGLKLAVPGAAVDTTSSLPPYLIVLITIILTIVITMLIILGVCIVIRRRETRK